MTDRWLTPDILHHNGDTHTRRYWMAPTGNVRHRSPECKTKDGVPPHMFKVCTGKANIRIVHVVHTHTHTHTRTYVRIYIHVHVHAYRKTHSAPSVNQPRVVPSSSLRTFLTLYKYLLTMGMYTMRR